MLKKQADEEAPSMPDTKILPSRGTYQIKVQGNLDLKWRAWFDGFAITPLPGGETLLVGAVVDQAALQGLLAKIHDLNLTILLVQRTDHDQIPTKDL
jgi:hypothetical protein